MKRILRYLTRQYTEAVAWGRRESFHLALMLGCAVIVGAMFSLADSLERLQHLRCIP